MVDATFDLLDLCVRSHVRKVVVASSASVYGMATEFPTSERHHPYADRTLYGAAKAFGEGMLRSFSDMHGLDYVALRYFNVYGPRMDIHGRYTEVLVRWMERVEAGLPPVVFGDGKQTMDLVHVTDVARANLLAATAEASDVVLNVGSGTETSLLELARLVGHVMGQDHLRPIHEPERTVNPVPRRLADIEAARQLIGFEASVPLEDGISGVVDWWRGQRLAAASVGERAA
jgi:UDP-glucose 4-epimerase